MPEGSRPSRRVLFAEVEEVEDEDSDHSDQGDDVSKDDTSEQGSEEDAVPATVVVPRLTIQITSLLQKQKGRGGTCEDEEDETEDGERKSNPLGLQRKSLAAKQLSGAKRSSGVRGSVGATAAEEPVSRLKRSRRSGRRCGFVDAGVQSIDLSRMGKLLRKQADEMVLTQFWAEVKRRIILRYVTVERAFKVVGEGALQVNEFNILLRNVGITTLDTKAVHNVFTKATSGDRQLTLEELKTTLMGPTLQRLSVLLNRAHQNRKKIQCHIASFIRGIANASEQNRCASLYRFQRKLSIEFCMDLWSRLTKTKSRFREVDLSTFILVACDAKKARRESWQVYERDFLRIIYESVDRRVRNWVDIFDLTTCILMLGAESSRKEKFFFLSCIFDDDADGCLTHEQMLRMYCCAVLMSAIARGNKQVYDADVSFGDELSLQEARRCFDLTLETLKTKGTFDDHSRLQSIDELWEVLESFNEHTLDRLVPGTHRASFILLNEGPPRSLATKRAATGQKRDAKMGSRLLPRSKRGEAETAVTDMQHFRLGIARSFRHAVRGEWNMVAALRTPSEGSRDGTPRDDSESCLPCTVLPDWEPPAQGDVNWSVKHGQTLTEWLHGGMPADTGNLMRSWKSSGGLNQSMSELVLPAVSSASPSRSSLKIPAVVRHGSQRRSSQLLKEDANGQSPALSKVSGGTSLPSLHKSSGPKSLATSGKHGNISLPSLHNAKGGDTVDIRHGKSALKRFHDFELLKVEQKRPVRQIEPVSYYCRICSYTHDLHVECDPFA